MYIYKITCLINNKVYVGQTTETLERRFKRHIGYNKNDNDTKFYRAIRKYGAENFKIELLEEANSRKHLDELEEYWIKKLDSINNGYNTALGRIGGDTLSKNPNLKNIKDKIRAAKIGGNNPNSAKIKMINVKTNEVKYYNSMSECQKENDIPRHDIIQRRCVGKITKPYRDMFLFEYNKEV